MEENIKQINAAINLISSAAQKLRKISDACDVLGLAELSAATGNTFQELTFARIVLDQVRYRLNEARNVPL